VRSLKIIHDNLARAQTEFLGAADVVVREQWCTRPGADRWSAGELVAHLMSIERAILWTADRILEHPPRPVSFLKSLHLPMVLVESRLVRRKSPIPLDPALLCEKEEMLAGLRGVRDRTFSFIEETRGRDLGPYRYRHPFLGSLNLYEWLQLIASHEVRHAKQMKEIAGSLPKAVVSLQK
jgi:hypothetical protein